MGIDYEIKKITVENEHIQKLLIYLYLCFLTLFS